MSPNLTLAKHVSRSTKGNNLNNLDSTCIENATYKVSRSLVYWFWRKRFIKAFTTYGHGGHVGHVTQLICINFHSYSPSSFLWMDARRPVPWLWIPSAEVRGGGGTPLGEWEHNNNKPQAFI